MKLTSQEAAKMLKQYNEQLAYILNNEAKRREFLAALGEDVDSVRPVYDYEKTQSEIDDINGKIRKLKHAINLFNTTQIIPGFDMTIDEMLVFIPQLTKQRDKLWTMMNKLPKVRETAGGFGKNTLIDYRYANYDIGKAKKDYDEVAECLNMTQTALDLVNSTETMDLDI